VFQSRNDSSALVNGTVAYTDSIVNNNKTPLRTLLSAGSTVWLNSGASLYIASGFNGMDRKVKLEGEAFFDIKQDANRPFYTIADNITIHVLGTTYNMEAYSSEKQLRVSLLSGSVVVRNNDTSCLLHPGEMAVYGKRSRDLLVEPTAAADPAAWITGKIVMNRISLEDALQRLTRLYDVPIEYDAQIVKGKYITGEFDRDKLPVVLQSILFVHNLKFTRMSNGGFHVSGNSIQK
jgi:ferric-dicitrate binding protein FerR (iron transport regulator)